MANQDSNPGISLEYTAAFIDADGCISCSDNGAGNPKWEVTAFQGVDNGNVPLVAMHVRWGGALYMAAPRMWRWKVTGVEAGVFLQDIRDHLMIKQHKADAALEWYRSHKKFGRILQRIDKPAS